jgi:membrane-associated protein
VLVTSASDAASSLVALGPEWLSPENILTSFGSVAFWVVVAIIFAECGLLIGFFLPGDSLLFVTGLFIASGAISMNIALACAILFAAAVVGNAVGYWIGRTAGPAVFRRPDSRLFRQEYVDRTERFFHRYGPTAIVLARFTPVVRTFITVAAGVGRMPFRTFLLFSAIGGLVWAVGVTLLGYFLGSFEFVKNNIDLMLLAVVAVSAIPLVHEIVKHRRQRSGTRGAEDPGAADRGE